MTPARSYFPGMGQAVADRTVNRKVFSDLQKLSLPRTIRLNPKDPNLQAWLTAAELSDWPVVIDETTLFRDRKPQTRVETWAEVSHRVAEGNAALDPNGDVKVEQHRLEHHLRQASVLMSGRHLQHGDKGQIHRNMEVFTNCLDGSTKILTMEHGAIEIDKIAGTTVHVIAGDGVPRPAMIHAHGEQEVFDITFRQHTTGPTPGLKPVVRATENHRWKLADGTITDKLRVGDIIMPPKVINDYDPKAVIHGLIFGDGTAHKRRLDHTRPAVSQGRTYASIRVCKQDTVREEIHRLLDEAGYGYMQCQTAVWTGTGEEPEETDRVYYIGKMPYAKDLPFTKDPEYIAGFIYGWWLADGHKGVKHALEISTANQEAANWLLENAAYAGFTRTMHRVMERKEGDGSYANGKPLNVIRIRNCLAMKVESIAPAGKAKVYCPEEPVTSTFVLANGLLTGNCATAATSFLLFYLLLNGAGVGRCYDDEMIAADFNDMPIVVNTIDWSHEDVKNGSITGYLTRRDAEHLYANRTITVHEVADSREGWAKIPELIERYAFEGRRDEVLIFDYTGVRPRNMPIMGMQGRPASGPGPLMGAIAAVAKLREAGMEAWRAAMYFDHYMAECVLVGGARRAARMATKHWRDKTIFGFINLKRGGFLWSSNNSVTIDEEFRSYVRKMHKIYGHIEDPDKLECVLGTDLKLRLVKSLEAHAYRVARALSYAAYHDGTGEPGLINQDRIEGNTQGLEAYCDGLYAQSAKFKIDPDTLPLMQTLAKTAHFMRYSFITNPCGEIRIIMLGGYCVIADVVPFHAANDTDAEDGFRVATRALIRTNLMDCIYSREVRRTNRIGVGITGFHEWAYSRFRFTWHDIVDEAKSMPMWLMLSRFKRAIVDEAQRYSEELGVTPPHTDTTFKPAGTTSKLFGLTEGAHLPSMREFLRWVQFRHDDPLVETYKALGYPIKELKSYSGTTVVGFPTKPTICSLDGGAWVVTAAEATPEDQYQFLRLIEKYWIVGVAEDGVTPLSDTGNQVSYTLKYDPKKVSYKAFLDTLIEGQFSIRCCSVMPQTDTTAYEYLPETSVSKMEYEKIAASIKTAPNVREEIGREHVGCGSGGCPVDFDEEAQFEGEQVDIMQAAE